MRIKNRDSQSVRDSRALSSIDRAFPVISTKLKAINSVGISRRLVNRRDRTRTPQPREIRATRFADVTEASITIKTSILGVAPWRDNGNKGWRIRLVIEPTDAIVFFPPTRDSTSCKGLGVLFPPVRYRSRLVLFPLYVVVLFSYRCNVEEDFRRGARFTRGRRDLWPAGRDSSGHCKVEQSVEPKKILRGFRDRGGKFPGAIMRLELLRFPDCLARIHCVVSKCKQINERHCLLPLYHGWTATFEQCS